MTVSNPKNPGLINVRQPYLRAIGSTIVAILLVFIVMQSSALLRYPQTLGKTLWTSAHDSKETAIKMGKMVWTDEHGVPYNATEAAEEEAIEDKEDEEKTPKTKGVNEMVEVYPLPPPADDEEYMAMCTFGKNVHEEFREYLTFYYYHHGIRRFYVWDDGSDIPLSEHPGYDSLPIPAEHINFTWVEPGSIPPDERVGLQHKIHKACTQNGKDRHTWMGDMDMDEFIEMRNPEYPTLKGWLQSHEKEEGVGALEIRFLPHNSAGIMDFVEGGFRKNFNVCVSHSFFDSDQWFMHQGKIWARVDLGVWSDIHDAINPDGLWTWDETSRAGEGDALDYKYWALHHYATGSRRYFEQKMSRGRTDHVLAKEGREQFAITEDYWSAYHAHVDTYECLEMTKYKP